MNKKLMAIATMAIISTGIVGCSNQAQPLQVTQATKSEQVSISSNQGINNFMKNFAGIYFSMLDINKDDSLTLQEYLYQSSDTEPLKSAFKKIDKNNDGKISLNDAKNSANTFLNSVNVVSSKEKIREYIKSKFSSADTNKDSQINENEFLFFVNKEFAFFINNSNALVSSSLAEFMFGTTDKNNDKKISFSEYEDFYYKMTIAIMSSLQVIPPVAPAPEPYPSDSPYEPVDPYPTPPSY